MKTKLLLLFCLPLLFAACDQNSDLASTTDLTGLTSRGPCFDLETTHWLSGQGDLRLTPELAPQEAYGNLPSERYVIEASGDAMSETYARGFSVLELVYSTKTHAVTGTLVTRFYYGEVLEMSFEGNAQVQHEVEMRNLLVDIQTATFTTESEVYELATGEISFLIPLKPEGAFQVNLTTSSTLCNR